MSTDLTNHPDNMELRQGIDRENWKGHMIARITPGRERGEVALFAGDQELLREDMARAKAERLAAQQQAAPNPYAQRRQQLDEADTARFVNDSRMQVADANPVPSLNVQVEQSDMSDAGIADQASGTVNSVYIDPVVQSHVDDYMAGYGGMN